MRRFHTSIFILLALAFATSLFARGQFWDFLGYTRVDCSQDHAWIQIARSDRLFRSVQLRVGGDAIFFDRLVLHFGNGTSQELIIGDRISPGGRDYVVDFLGERALESVEFWYYREPWARTPLVTVYGSRSSTSDSQSVAREQ